MKNVLFFTPSLGSGGAERQMVNTTKILNRKGYHIFYLVFDNSDLFYAEELKKHGFSISFIFAKRDQIPGNVVVLYLKLLIGLLKSIKVNRIDIVVTFLPMANFIASLGRYFKNYKLIIGERSSNQDDLCSKVGRLFAKSYAKADYIVCNSNNASSMWQQHYPKYANKLRVIYNLIDCNIEINGSTHQMDHIFHVIVPASYQENKNAYNVLRAIALMTQEERNLLRVDWYGNNSSTRKVVEEYNRVISLCETLGVGNTISFYGQTHDIHQKIYEADCVAIFSFLEGLPNAICEGLKLGKPIIMTRVSDYNNLVDESNGILCDADDPASIKNALVMMEGKNDMELKEMGQASIRKAEELFSEASFDKNWSALLESL